MDTILKLDPFSFHFMYHSQSSITMLAVSHTCMGKNLGKGM